MTQTFGSASSPIVDGATLKQNRDSIRAHYLASADVGLAPYECRDVADWFQDVMALADNAFMRADAVSRGNRPDAAGEVVLQATLRDYRKNLERLRYELEKVT